MRTVLLLAGVLLLAACQRDYPADHPATTAGAVSAWDFIDLETGPRMGDSLPVTEQPEQEIEPSIELGPAFSETDTVDEELLAGVWLQFCQTRNERIDTVPVEHMDVLEIGPSGQLVWHFINEGQDNPQAGWWEKTSPGVVAFQLGEQPGNEFRLQMFGGDFFFFWNYAGSIGMWFARLPEEASPRIEHNHFSSNLGDFHFESVNDNVYYGTAEGEYTRDIAGIYTNGILLMRWEEPETNAAGYAAFIVAPDWSELNGVWWIDDYEAAPFGGPYTAQPIAGE
jgi:hypothetical protein